MSSTTTTIVTTDAAATTVERHTYWCHECDMSVSLLSSSTTTTASLLCPYCHSDFLEEMDSPLFTPNPISDPDPNPSPFPSFLDPIISPPHTLAPNESTTFQFSSATPADDNFLLDSPYLHRLIHHLSNSDSDGSSPSTISRLHSPASKSAVEAIPTTKITKTFLEIDPIILCAVCKDQFIIDDETKQLPCKHMYHPDCILPWLSQHNSCPVCRFQLPIEGVGDLKGRRRRSRNRILRLGELMEDDEELFGFGSTLRHISGRHRLVLRRRENREESLFSPTQIGEDEMGGPGRANSAETVSSWPNWPVEGGVGAGVGVGGAGVGEIVVSAARVNDEGDIVMS